MSFQISGIQIRDENHEVKTERAILMEYFNQIVKECRKNTKGKTYEEIDEIPNRFSVFTNRLGHFEDKIKDTARELLGAVTYKPHREQLQTLANSKIVRLYPDTDNPLNDCNGMIKEIRKNLKELIKIYEQHELRGINLVSGYGYF